MSAIPPEDADSTDRERSAAEVDAEFASIISSIADNMAWASSPRELDESATDGQDSTEDLMAEPDGLEAARERERRRALRRAQRAEEVAAFEASQAQAEAELQADDAHFVPPEPPPLPTPRRRTVVALLFMVVGLVMLVRPTLVQVAPDAVLVLGIGCLVGGFAMLIYGLRPRASDPDDADGWDDGARL